MRYRVLVIGLIAGTLAACSGAGPDPSPTPIRTTTSSAAARTTPHEVSATPSRTGPLTTGPGVKPGQQPPTLPTLARQHTPAGAEAFAEYYFGALDWSIATNDAYLISKISATSCDACARVISGVSELRANGQVERGGRITVRQVELDQAPYELKSDYVAKVVYDEGAVRLVGPGSGARTTAKRVRNSEGLVFISWQDHEWLIIEVTRS